MTRVLALVISAGLHLAVVALLMQRAAAALPPPPRVMLSTAAESSHPELLDGSGGTCPARTYSGIGITFKFDLGAPTVTNAPPSYPAYQAGIRVGDMLGMIPFADADGYMSVAIVRGGKNLTFRIKTSTICFEERP